MINSRDLKDLLPKVKELAEKLIKLAKEKGIDIIVTQTYRDKEYQDSLYAQGRTKAGSIVTNAKGGTSYHNYRMAFDIAIMNKDGKTVNWNDSADTNKDGKKDYYQVGAIGKSIGLEWGGDFVSIKDIPHFQYTFGLSIKDLQAGKKPKQ